MKRVFSILLIVLMLVSLCACGGAPSAAAPTPMPIPDKGTPPPLTPAPPPEAVEPEIPEVSPAPTFIPTPVPTPENTAGGSYIEILENPAQGIYEGPGYDYGKVGIILQATGYTVMEEASDDEGNLWGRLKSGIGWVDLTSARAFEGTPPLLTANFADLSRIDSPCREFYPLEDSEYAILTDIRATAAVTDVELCMLEPFENTVTESYGHIAGLEAMEPMLTKLIFWGDFTTYGVFLKDESGTERLFSITMSGRNGELIVNEIDITS